MAGPEGFEPSLCESKSQVLPITPQPHRISGVKEGNRTPTEMFTAFRADHYTTDTIVVLLGASERT